MSSTENSYNPSDEAEIKKEALKRTILTIEALDKMCSRQKCDIYQMDRCTAREKALECIINLTFEGFTVTELQCNFGKPLKHLDPKLWETVCYLCVEHLSDDAKLNCKYRKAVEKMHQSLAEYGFAIIDMYCQKNPLRSRFKMP